MDNYNVSLTSHQIHHPGRCCGGRPPLQQLPGQRMLVNGTCMVLIWELPKSRVQWQYSKAHYIVLAWLRSNQSLYAIHVNLCALCRSAVIRVAAWVGFAQGAILTSQAHNRNSGNLPTENESKHRLLVAQLAVCPKQRARWWFP